MHAGIYPTAPATPRAAEPTPALVRWDLITAIGEALATTADGRGDIVLPRLRGLLDSLTTPHRLLESLEAEANAVLAGDSRAAIRLAERFDVLARSIPALIGSRERAKALVRSDAPARDDYLRASHDDSLGDHSTLSFDALARLGAAATTMSHRTGETLGIALDVVMGLAMRAAAADRLLRGLVADGPAGAAKALNELRLIGHPSVAPPLMQTLSGNIPGLPGGPLGPLGPLGGPTGGPGTGGPLGPDEIPDAMGSLVAGLRDQHRWDPEIHDYLPTWREIVGLAPIEGIDRAEIYRVRCMIALTDALTQRQEPPPPRPKRVVWSDTITSITVGRACAGDRMVIHGSKFGPPNPEFGVVLPVASGCKAFAVPAADWSNTTITVTLPTDIVSGTVGLVDVAYARAYDDWATRMNLLTARIIENAKCAHTKAPDVQYVPLFNECAPLTPSNRLRAGLPVIRAFKVNGQSLAFVEPGQSVRLSWDLANTDSFHLKRVPSFGPTFHGADHVDNPPNFDYDLGPFPQKQPVTAKYELRATGPCGDVTVVVEVRLRKVPILLITGVEITQGIQAFGDPSAPDNSVPLVAHKDTIVRVYVAVDNLGDFAPTGSAGKVAVSGEIRLVGPSSPLSLPPVDATFFTAGPAAKLNRRESGATLNFRIPAGVAHNSMYHAMLVTVWTKDEVEAPPTGVKTRPSATFIVHSIIWNEKAAFKVRYVRIATPRNAAPSDAQARELVMRAFDLLATPATDIQPARVPIWNSSVDTSDLDGMDELLGHIDDQHNCTLSERLPFFDDDCPDDDGAVWAGIMVNTGGEISGLATSFRTFSTSRNTCIAESTRITVAHELAHCLAFNHVNPGVSCGFVPDQDADFDTLPDGGVIKVGDALDPAKCTVVPGFGALYDMMTYGCERWVSRVNWRRVFDKF